MNAKELRQQITTQIIEALEQDILPWRKPWRSSPNAGRPANVISAKTYRGINPLILNLRSFRHGFSSRWWGTYRQWKKLGCQVQPRPKDVKRGHWGCRVVFYQPIDRTVIDEATGDEVDEQFFVMKSYLLFNADQVNGADQFRCEEQDDALVFNHEPAEQLIEATKADIRHYGTKAYYARPIGDFPNHHDGDYITVPPKRLFDTMVDYYDTVFHELGHWSEDRLGWEDRDYAYGELVAEIASCFVATEIGLPLSNIQNHVSYLKSWLEGMKQDSRFIFQASTQASKVADFLMKFSHSQTSKEAVCH